ncbi:hypothetical protein GCM10011504_48870 [Siccirubricoccus deserti]|uniref:DUF2946 domain-containing protein n=1 Tax=Siccirubricoccus deserti TaxID=2013562 RepID=A0A9X0R3X2_9PROT|nr:hypothetical protein [Siccirubricoccus deserti]MBC4018383.1 hypothetical protein [Siccirubricoccus deserti]GGC65061.1 hypothetical protein GCM10011504_48870 [Siccirubricoccus deserti]
MRGGPDRSFSRVIATLLALILLALPGAPVRHAPAAAPSHAPSHQHAAHHRPTDAGAAQAPAPASGERGHPGDIPGMTCCLSAQCPALAGAPPPAATGLPPPAGPATRFAAVPRLRLGIEFPPALPPPRAA